MPVPGCALVILALTIVGAKKQEPWLDAIKDRLGKLAIRNVSTT